MISLFKDLQPENVPPSIEVIPLGIIISDNDIHSLNAEAPILAISFGIVIFFNLNQYIKAAFPIHVTLLGMSKLVNSSQL